MGQKILLDLSEYAGQPTQRLARDKEECRKRSKYYASQISGYAGKCTTKISETMLHSRKQVLPGKHSSMGVREALYDALSETSSPLRHHKKPLLHYANAKDQRKYFKTAWIPNYEEKMMEFQVHRKDGSANVEMKYNLLDTHKTYLCSKRPLKRGAGQSVSHLQFDRFLTVSEHAERSDRPKEVKNRDIPFANPNGPFETQDPHVAAHRRDNLDRTLTPRLDSCRRDTYTARRLGPWDYRLHV